MPERVISLGDLVLDLIMPVRFPIEGGHSQAPPWQRAEPGGAANFLFAAQHMGLDVLPVGTVGADGFGDMILNLLREQCIDTRYVSALPGSTSTVVAVLTDQASGEHAFIGHFGTGPEVPYPDGLDGEIARVAAVFLAGYTLAEQRMVDLAVRAVERARGEDVPIFLDVGPFMAQVAPELVRWAVEHADTILLTEDEIPLVADAPDEATALAALLAQGPEALIVKRGAGGCTVVTREGQTDVPGFPTMVVDTVGAGDCFAGAFVAGRLAGLSRQEAARLANAMGAASVAKVGAGRNAPTLDEVRTVLEAAGEALPLAFQEGKWGTEGG